MPYILNLETATETCSVCISEEEEIIAFEESIRPFDHSRVITLLIESCLKTAKLSLKDMEAIAVSAGPGSYTSLRVGASTAKGICYALDKPLISIDTLDALALATIQKERISGLYCPMIDARRMEVYCALYDENGIRVSPSEPKVIDTESFQEYFASGANIVFSGSGAEKCREILNFHTAIFSSTVCSAKYLPALSSKALRSNFFTELSHFAPNYQKPPNVTSSKKNPFPRPPKSL